MIDRGSEVGTPLVSVLLVGVSFHSDYSLSIELFYQLQNAIETSQNSSIVGVYHVYWFWRFQNIKRTYKTDRGIDFLFLNHGCPEGIIYYHSLTDIRTWISYDYMNSLS